MSARPDGRDELDRRSIGDPPGRRAARPAAPGAGATAAVEAALPAPLVAMVGRSSAGGEHTDLVDEIVAAAEGEAAFPAVAATTRMPRGTTEQQEPRRRRPSRAQLGAIRQPLAHLRSAGELVALSARVLPVAPQDLVSVVAAATAGVDDPSRRADRIEADVRQRLRR